MGATLRYTGDRIDNGNLLPTFVHGAYNLGPVYESKEIATTAVHAGEAVIMTTGADGEDTWLIMPTASVSVAGHLELDLGLVAGASTDYSVGDDVKCLVHHWNVGSLMRNIQTEDPAGNVNAGQALGTTSGTAGSYDDDATTYMNLGSYRYVADGSAPRLVVAWIKYG